MFIFVFSTMEYINVVILVEIDQSQFITAQLQLPFVTGCPSASKALGDCVQVRPKHLGSVHPKQ